MIRFVFLAISLLLVGVDQIVKYFVVIYLKSEVTFPIINNVLHLTYAENTGAAFGLFQGKQTFLIILTLILIGVAVLLIFSKKINNYFFLSSLSLIIAGGLGNFIDRIFRGFVVDYIDFKLINFAIFNLADMFVVFGSITAVVYVIFMDTKIKNKKMLIDKSTESDQAYK